jgi:hypothetical protein
MRRSDIHKKLEDLEKEVRELKEEVQRRAIPLPVPYYPVYPIYPQPYYPEWPNRPWGTWIGGAGPNTCEITSIGRIDSGCQTVFKGNDDVASYSPLVEVRNPYTVS